MLFADSISISYCKREKVDLVEVLICLCIDCGDIICIFKISFPDIP